MVTLPGSFFLGGSSSSAYLITSAARLSMYPYSSSSHMNSSQASSRVIPSFSNHFLDWSSSSSSFSCSVSFSFSALHSSFGLSTVLPAISFET
ncbi:hypothetical protein QL285_028021 [Trifolium repens]|nr:hypothetical protein QL285_028021 [Trifolium repens]